MGGGSFTASRQFPCAPDDSEGHVTTNEEARSPNSPALLVAYGLTDGTPLSIVIAFALSPLLWLVPVAVLATVMSGPVGVLVLGVMYVWESGKRLHASRTRPRGSGPGPA